MIKYNEEYDAHYDDKLDVWMERKCGDTNCSYCSNRPKKPSMIK